MSLLEGIMYLDQRTPELLLPGDVIKVFDINKTYCLPCPVNFFSFSALKASPETASSRPAPAHSL
jgi:hypothetical protein